MSSRTTVLAIETSCDETGIAVVRKEGERITVLAGSVASQIDIHAKTGGVVPEVAAREHVTVFRPLLEHIMAEAKVTKDDIDAVAVTVGPGLMPALSVGVTAAQTLAFAWGKPVVPVHHIEGHIYSALLQNSKAEISNFQFPISKAFPALALIVSGGHTLLIRVDDHLQYKILGSTRDDAAGEVFDKVARMLGLPYPGGPHVSTLAEKGNSEAIQFPRPMRDSGDLDFSFSGLKTAVLYKLRDMSEDEKKKRKADVAAGFQKAVVDSLTQKVTAALRGHPESSEGSRDSSSLDTLGAQNDKPYKTVLLAGGVAANKLLRSQLEEAVKKHNIPLRIAPLALCGDNAVMIGMVGCFAYEAGRTVSWQNVDAIARVSIEEYSR